MEFRFPYNVPCGRVIRSNNQAIFDISSTYRRGPSCCLSPHARFRNHPPVGA
jgi:hypothetical protein